MKTWIASLALAAAVLLGAPAVHAQDRPDPVRVPVAAPAVDPVKAALIRRYFDAIQITKLMNGMMESMMGPMLARGDLTAEKQEVLRTVALEAFAAVLPEVMDSYTAIYADAFTVEELEGLVAFYESPVGQSLMRKSVVLSRQAGDVFTRFTPILEREMMTRLCARTECPAATPDHPAESSAKRR